MSLPVIDCRSLIQFCRAFPPQNSNRNLIRQRRESLNPFSYNLCDRSPLAALDLIILALVLASVAFLILPYIKFFMYEVVPSVNGLIVEVILDEPVAYVVGVVVVVLGLMVGLFVDTRLRKCGNPYCRGLRRAVEYDIQLETEACARQSAAGSGELGVGEVELGEDRKELEAELKKMAPLNGRTVLIFRAPCGCPLGRLEVWGYKKVRRIKK